MDDELVIDPIDVTDAAVEELLNQFSDPDSLETVGLRLIVHGTATLANRTQQGNAGAAAELRRLADMVPVRLN